MGDVVQSGGDAYRASVAIAPFARGIGDASAWTKLGPATATAEYRTETDSYRRVVGHWRTYGPDSPSWAYPDSLEVFEPDGTILKYAARATSYARVDGPARRCAWVGTTSGEHSVCQVTELQRRAWMLDTVEDRFGNRMEIDYDSVESLLPVEIRYTYHPSAPATKAIRFLYEPRPDIRRATMDGVAYTTAKRLKTIEVVGPLGLSQPPNTQGVLYRYELAYEQNPVTAQSMLTQVTMCAPGAACLSPLRFGYSGNGPVAYTDKLLPISPVSGSAFVPGFDGFRTADVNGDGFDDVLYRKVQGWAYRLSDGVGLGAERTTGILPYPDDPGLGMSLVDLDRNQTADALVPLGGTSYAILRGLGGSLQGSVLPNIFTPGTGASGPSLSRVVAVADFNGDTLPDLAVRHACRGARPLTPPAAAGYTACRWGVALNQSTSAKIDFASAMDFRWTDAPCTEPTDVGWPGPVNAYENCAEAPLDDPAFVLDVDRNGENELIVPVRRGPREEFFRQPDYSVELKALGFPIPSASALRPTGLSSRQMQRLFLDVNGDALPDAAAIDGGQLSIAMNVGGTFEAPNVVAVSAALSLPNELRVGDFNDDGLEDIYLVSSHTVLQSNGQLGFIPKTLPIPAGEDSCTISVCPDFARRKWDQLLDFNGDGLTDVLQMRGGQAHLLQRIGPAPGLLETVTGGPLQPKVRFSYKPSALPEIHTPTGCGYPQVCLRKGMWLVSEVGVKANVTAQFYPDGFNRTLYTYAGGRFDVRGRGWLGFSQRVTIDAQTGAKTTTTMDNGWAQARLSNPAIYRYPGAFRTLREVVVVDDRPNHTGSGKVHRWTTEYEYQDRFVGPVATSVLVATRQTYEEAHNETGTVSSFTPVSSRRSTFDVNQYGLVTKQSSETFAGGFTATNTVPPGAEVTRLQITRNPMPIDQLNWLVRRYDRVAVTSTEPPRAAVPASATEPARPAVPKRSVTRISALRWKPGTSSIERVTVEPDHAGDRSLFSVTELEYEPTGNVSAIRTEASSGAKKTKRLTRIRWDTLDQTLISRREDSLKHAETLVYYAGLGQLFSATDANGLETTIRRDRFGRPREIEPASSAGSRISYELAPDARLLVTSRSASGEVSRWYEDQWGELVREEQSRLHDKPAIVVRTFDRLGQLTSRDAALLRRRHTGGERRVRLRQPRPADRDRDRENGAQANPATTTTSALCRCHARRRDLGLRRTRDQVHERPRRALDNDRR